MGQLKANFTVGLNGGCPNQTATFTNTSTSTLALNSVICIWNLGNGKIDTTYSLTKTVSTVYTTGQTFSPTLTVLSGGESSTKSQTITLGAVTASFTISPTKGCLPLTDTFTNTSQYGGRDLAQCFWDFGDGNTLRTTGTAGNTVTHTYYTSGSPAVQMTILTDSACESYLRKVNVIPITAGCGAPSNGSGASSGTGTGSGTTSGAGAGVHASFTYTSQFVVNKICTPQVFYFTNTSSTAIRLSWNFGDGSTAENIANPSHSYTMTGICYVTLTIMGPDSTTSTITEPVNIYGTSAVVRSNIVQTCKPAEVTLVASGIINSIRASWNFGDGTVLAETDSVVTHRYASPGVYRPALNLWDSLTCPGSFGLTVPLVIDSLHVSIHPSMNHVCDSALVRFTPGIYSVSNSLAGEALTYHWDFGTGLPGDTASVANPNFDYSIPGKYPTRLTVGSIPGCLYTTQDTILVTKSAHGTITGPSEACSGAPISFSAVQNQTAVTLGAGGAAPTGGGVSTGGSAPTGGSTAAGGSASAGQPGWDWILPEGLSDTGQYITVPAPAQGQYTIDLVAVLNGCFDTTTAQLLVKPSPDIALSPQNPRICLGDSVQLMAHDGNTYQWSPAPGLNNNETSTPGNVVTPVVPTTYKVSATNQYGCTSRDSDFVFVATPFTLRLPQDTFVCTGSAIVLEPGGAATYSWISGAPAGASGSGGPAADPGASAGNPAPGSGASAGNPGPPAIQVSPLVNTPYTVVGYDTDHCFTDTATVNVSVEPLPTVQATPVGTIPAGNSVNLQATGSADVTSWEWSPADYLSCTDCGDPVSTPQSSFGYMVTGKTQYGCAASDSLKIQLVCLEDRVSVPNAFTPNNDGFNDVFYPRGKGVRMISSFLIFNRWGNTVFERHNIPLDDAGSGWDGKVNGADQPTGGYVYALLIVCDTGDIFSLKGTVLLER